VATCKHLGIDPFVTLREAVVRGCLRWSKADEEQLLAWLPDRRLNACVVLLCFPQPNPRFPTRRIPPRWSASDPAARRAVAPRSALCPAQTTPATLPAGKRNGSMPRCLQVATTVYSTAAVFPPTSLRLPPSCSAQGDRPQRPLAQIIVDRQIAPAPRTASTPPSCSARNPGPAPALTWVTLAAGFRPAIFLGP